MLRRKVNIWTSNDWITIILFLVLVFLGWINIYASVFNEETSEAFDFSQRYGKQLIWISAALIVAFLVEIIDSRFYSFFAYLIYGLIIFALILVLIVGREVHGARSWFEFGELRMQPSEFAKIATSLALARYLSMPNRNIHSIKTIFNLALIILLPAFLILIQPDTGSAIVFVTFVLVLYREGLSGTIMLIGLMIGILSILSLFLDKLIIVTGLVLAALIALQIIERRKKFTIYALVILSVTAGMLYGLKFLFDWRFSIYFLIVASVFLSGILFLYLGYKLKIKEGIFVYLILIGTIVFSFSVDYVFHDVLEPHQQKRINILLGFETDPYGSGYNINQSKIAIGSGGFSGKGFLNGTQTKFKFVPEQSTDFIFCTVGEEWGFVGTFTVILLFVILLLRIIYLAERQRSAFTRIYGYSVFSVLFFHVAVNIGMTIGLLPVIGIPLPFFSYGGSSLWAFTILLFIFLRLDASRMEYLV
ncbi:MAG: rod shape-determining protein RodA [Bacteroidales bacterium]|nr:MAG: rod shape-determining protein RodA [Bacteroidales bacterium]